MTHRTTARAAARRGGEHAALTAVPDRPEAHTAIAAAIAAQGFGARVADRLAADAVRVILPMLDEVDEQQGPANYAQDNYEAGWHGVTNELRVLFAGSR